MAYRIVFAPGIALFALHLSLGGASAQARVDSAPIRTTPAGASDSESPSRDSSASATADELSPDEVDALIQKLASPKWRERKAARSRLIALGPAIYDRLIEGYRSARSFELRLGIKEVASEVFVATRFPSETGFLGVRQTPLNKDRLGTRPTGDAESAILIVAILPDSAAERAGLQAGDLIIRLNGQNIAGDPTGSAFSKMVGSFKPGARVELDVIRGNQEGRIPVVLGPRPMRYVQQPQEREAAREAWTAWWQQYFESRTSGRRPPATQPTP